MAASQFRDVAVSQLQANVLQLQSQIILAKAAIEMKNATLDAKDTQIALLEDKIDLRTFQAQPHTKGADPGREELVKDFVSVKKWDYKFLEIDFPPAFEKAQEEAEIARRCSKLFPYLSRWPSTRPGVWEARH